MNCPFQKYSQGFSIHHFIWVEMGVYDIAKVLRRLILRNTLKNIKIVDRTPVLLFHGSGERSLVSIAGEGMSAKFGQRKVYGPGVYMTDKFEIALSYAAHARTNYQKGMFVIAIACILGRVKQINTAGDHTFDDGIGGVYNTKQVARENFFIAGSDSQLMCVGFIHIKTVEKVVIVTEEEKLAALQLLQKEADRKREYEKAAPQREIERVRLVKEAADKKQQWDDAAPAREKEAKDNLEAHKLDMENRKCRMLVRRQAHLADSDTSMQECGNIRLGDAVTVNKMLKGFHALEDTIGIVKLIVRENSENDSKLRLMVEMCDRSVHDMVRIANVKKEKRIKKTGYSRSLSLSLSCFSRSCLVPSLSRSSSTASRSHDIFF